MKIGELAERTGLTTSRIRFYERIGLLRLVRREVNGYRSYPPEAVQVLGMIKASQEAGFSLDELRRLLPEKLDTWDHTALTDALRRKISDVEAMEQRLANGRMQMQAVLAAIEAKPDDVDCAGNARRVMAQMGFGVDVATDGQSNEEWPDK